MQKIITFLTFDRQAAEAVALYTSVFKNAQVLKTTRYGEAGPLPAGTEMSIIFQLEGQLFHALNAGPYFTFSNGISLFVNCETQEEVDELWEKLSEGGEKGPCGWLKDRFGVSWQIIPTALGNMLQDKDPQKANRVMSAMMQMGKIDIKTLEQAYNA